MPLPWHWLATLTGGFMLFVAQRLALTDRGDLVLAATGGLAAAAAPAAAPAAPAAATDAFSSLSLSTNEREHPCWGCGTPAPPLDQRPFLQCTLCVAAKYAVCCRFCGMQCYQKHLKRHKKWHKEKDARIEETATDFPRLRLEAEQEVAAPSADEYTRLVDQARLASYSGNPRAAVKLLKQAIKLAEILPGEQLLEPIPATRANKLSTDVEIFVGKNFE